MGDNDQVWFSMRLTADEKSRIKRLAQMKGTTAKDAVLNLVDQELKRIEAPRGNFLDGIEDLIGSVEGPGDLSTNPKHMEGFGEDAIPSRHRSTGGTD